VADALSEAIPELYEEPEQPAVLVLTSVPGAEVAIDGVLVGTPEDGTLRQSDVSPGRHQIRVTAPGRLPWSRVAEFAPGAELHLEAQLLPRVRRTEAINPLVWFGAGVAVGALAGAIALGVSSQATFELTREARLNGDVTRAEVVGFFDAREREAIAADVLFGVAGAAAIVGVVALFFPVVGEEPTEGVSLLPVPSGLVLQGGF
jgi:hypothetical protein